MKSLTEIKTEVDGLAIMIGATDHHSLPTYGRTEDGARPHIEVDARGYHFVVVERGQEQSRFTTQDLDDLLYKIFQTVTFSLACEYELAHRVETLDCRRMGFQRQVELLSQLSERWGKRETEEHERILEEHPFDDCSGVRATLTRELRAEGHAPATAWQKACERFPLPVE
ncbi:MAG TPA: Imm63 family immunity protein [Candidatus Limnocylindria bacterium]|nr:Imm63 family immunity protein [Candidatus Limnocylindria bacterium]